MNRRAKFWTRLIVLFTVGVGAWGQVSQSEHLYFTFRDAEGLKQRFRVEKSVDPSGRHQVLVSYVEERTLMPDSERPLIYGRDIDEDGHMDIWFVRDRYNISAIYYDDPRTGDFNQQDENGFGLTSVQRIVTHHLELNNRRLVGLALQGAANFFSFAISNAEQAGSEYVLTQIELLELRARAGRRSNAPETQALAMAMFEKGWELNNEKITQSTHGDYFKLGALDLVAAGVAMKVFKWVNVGGQWVMKKVALTSVGKTVLSSLPKLSMGSIGGVSAPLAAKAMFGSITVEAFEFQVRDLISGFIAKNRLAQAAVKSISKQIAKLGKSGTLQVLSVYKTGLYEWKYIAVTQLTQVLAEAISRREVIYDPNPIIMAKNLFTDKDFLQNFFYMSNETMVLSGISSRDPNIKRRMIVCGLVAAANSTMMNAVVKGNIDPERSGLDAGWEIVVGNLQVQMDLAALRYFEKLSVKSANPKWKIMGYAIVLVDQFVGYSGYANATTALEGKPEVHVVPVVTELP